MKRIIVPVLLCLCLLLCACGEDSPVSRYESFAEELSARTELGFTAEIRAEYEDKTAEFTIDYLRSEDGCSMTVTEPELVRGVCARMKNGSTQLEYSNVILDVGELDGYGLTPVSALPVLVNAMESGHLDAHRREGSELVLTLQPDDRLSVELWMDGETMTPVRAEIASDGRTAVYCDITNWR